MDNKIVYGLMTLILNVYSVPLFMQGKVKEGVIRLILYIIPIAGQIFAVINFVTGLIQGIKILQMSDEDYAAADKEAFLVGFPKIKK